MLARVVVACFLVVAAATADAASAAIATPSMADCDGTAHATVLQAAPAGPVLEARAIWLDAIRLRWPGIEPGGRFRLHHSASGALVAAPGQPVTGSDGARDLELYTKTLPAAVSDRFRHVAAGVTLQVQSDAPALRDLHRQQLLLVQEADDGRVIRAARIQSPGALDDLFAAAGDSQLGAHPTPSKTRFALWAPTARNVAVCLHRSGSGPATSLEPLQFDAQTGVWSTDIANDRSGQYYTYVVDMHVDGVGMVRNRVTDPYAVSLTTDSRRGYIADLKSARLKPHGWDQAAAPDRVKSPTDAAIYELHVRDFSINDATVRPDYRGKYLAFTLDDTEGSRHLRMLAQAGITDVHLLPVFDFGTVPEAGCVTPKPSGAPDGETQQKAVMAVSAHDCFNWGYDPVHYTAPEGSYATDPADGAVRVLEFRRMVQALHRAGLRVGMDVVYNHTYAAGQDRWSVLDRIVPGYYHRLDEAGRVTTSTCCANTATEHRMMRKLMIDSAVTWATEYRIDSFRFDLMGHQPRAAMEELKARVNEAAGRDVLLIGEGWNFGEVADGARFVQASQLSLNGSGIATFSDRARDAIRGGGAGDNDERQVLATGFINSASGDRKIGDTLHFPKNGECPQLPLCQLADMVRVGLAGSLRDYRMQAHDGRELRLEQISYGGGQPAGYVTAPGEVVNYVENHDNQTLYDLNAFKLPLETSSAERARVQTLAAALNAFSQGIAYFHAGQELLRSKSMDRNSFNSGDWFNRLDWTGKDNYFGTGLPPARDNATSWPLMRPRLADARLKPTPPDIAWTRTAFNDLLQIRSSSTLFRMRAAADVKARLKFYNTGPDQVPEVIAGHLDGRDYPGAGFTEILYLVNVDTEAHTLQIDAERGKRYVLHPVHRAPGAADRRTAEDSRYDAATGRFTVPARAAVVFVVELPAELLIATYNLRYSGPDAPPNDWVSRRPRIKAILDQYRPDLLGTQEGLYQQIKDLATDQPDYAWIGLGRDGGSRGEFMAIFYRRDRFEPLEYDHFWLSDTPDVVASSTWGNGVKRMVTWARFLDKRTGREFYFWDTHLDHAVQFAREKSAELIRRRVDALPRDTPVFLVGDFNAVARDNRAYDILTGPSSRTSTNGSDRATGLAVDQALTDTWYAARERRNEDANSFTGFGPLLHEGKRIDWILSRGAIDVRAAEAVTLQPDGQWPSDHLPVMAWVTLAPVSGP